MSPNWREDPDLKGRFHPEYPDDLSVLVHEGSARFTDKRPEIMWARIVGRLEWLDKTGQPSHAYKAALLNTPHQLVTVKAGDEILLVAHKDYKHPIRVTHEYMADRVHYDITPCNRCGLPEVFDPISRLIEKTFSNLDAAETEMVYFTSFCPICGGVILVSEKGHDKA